jgi:glycosyltransferase involved in cell wall biosynthesis
MKILLVSHSLVTRSNHRLPEELARYPDIQLEVLTPEWWNEESRIVHQEKTADPHYRIRIGQAAIFREPMPNLFLFKRGLTEALRELQPDILDVQEEPFSLVMGQILALRKALAPRSKLIFYSFQNLYKHYPPPFSFFEQWAFRESPYACVSASEIGAVLRRKGYGGHIIINPPGVDPHVFHPQPHAQAEIREALGLAPCQPLIGYLGRLCPEKGVQDIVAALPLLPPSVRLLAIGGGDAQSIKQQARALGVTDRIIFIGAINRLDAPRYLSAVDMLIVPSRTTPRWKEQFGRVIIEAAMCGAPVIGSDSGAIPEVVGDGGLIFPEGNTRALAHAIQLLLDQPAFAAELGRRAQERALARFTWEKVAADRYAMYRELVER